MQISDADMDGVATIEVGLLSVRQTISTSGEEKEREIRSVGTGPLALQVSWDKKGR